jgi:hypothetical protein
MRDEKFMQSLGNVGKRPTETSKYRKKFKLSPQRCMGGEEV